MKRAKQQSWSVRRVLQLKDAHEMGSERHEAVGQYMLNEHSKPTPDCSAQNPH